MNGFWSFIGRVTESQITWLLVAVLLLVACWYAFKSIEKTRLNPANGQVTASLARFTLVCLMVFLGALIYFLGCSLSGMSQGKLYSEEQNENLALQKYKAYEHKLKDEMDKNKAEIAHYKELQPRVAKEMDELKAKLATAENQLQEIKVVSGVGSRDYKVLLDRLQHFVTQGEELTKKMGSLQEALNQKSREYEKLQKVIMASFKKPALPEATPTPTPVPVVVATPTPTPVPVVVATPTPTPVPVVVATPTPTPVPVVVATPTPTPVPVVITTPTPTPVPVVIATPTPTPVPIRVCTPTPTPIPTPTPEVESEYQRKIREQQEWNHTPWRFQYDGLWFTPTKKQVPLEPKETLKERLQDWAKRNYAKGVISKPVLDP